MPTCHEQPETAVVTITMSTAAYAPLLEGDCAIIEKPPPKGKKPLFCWWPRADRLLGRFCGPASRPAKSWWPRAELNHRHKDFQSRLANKPQSTTTRSHKQINRLQSSMCCHRSPSVAVGCPEVSHQCPMGQRKQRRGTSTAAPLLAPANRLEHVPPPARPRGTTRGRPPRAPGSSCSRSFPRLPVSRD